MTVERELIRVLRTSFALDWTGIHGASHWARVRENGLRLAESTGARANVVELFAFLHDSCRENDHVDPMHGARAAARAHSLAGSVIDIGGEDLSLLVAACEGHSDGAMLADVTVQTCWDADRLDLGRVGIRPDPRRLCTSAARDPRLIEWAWRRSLG
ncbi:MAG TPA: hypothetical protein VF422_09410 [Dokdonella sp.]